MTAACALVAALLIGALTTGSTLAGSGVGSGPGHTKIRESRGKFVPIPDEVPHVEGAYVDKRIRKDLIYIAGHFKILVVEGFAGRLPSGKKVGCPKCHVSDSEHKIGLGLDIVPYVRARAVPDAAEVAARSAAGSGFDARGGCDRDWRGVSRLARWAEPRQGDPNPPFRWVGYDGDEGHGCGDHLHLSWNHDEEYRKYRPSAWVETFR